MVRTALTVKMVLTEKTAKMVPTVLTVRTELVFRI